MILPLQISCILRDYYRWIKFVLKVKNSLYILSIKEWNIDLMLYRFLWHPFKSIGNQLGFLKSKFSLFVLFTIFLIGIYCDYHQTEINQEIYYFLPNISSLIGLLLILSAFAERKNAKWAWAFAVISQLFITLSIVLLNEDFGQNHIFIYLSGSAISAMIGFVCLNKVETIDNNIMLNQFHGYVHERPKTALVFLLSCLGLVGLPFTPTFIGIDLLFSHIHKHEELLIIFTALNFVFMELAIIRIYARIFLGQYKKPHHAMAYRSS